MGEKALDTHTLETYLQLESESDTKYEFYDGFIVAMAGGDPLHGKLAMNLGTALNNALREANKPCSVYSSDVKVAINTAKRRVYPDVSVVCGSEERDSVESKAITNPILVVEVLSESTESRDRGEKFMAYRQLSSLKEYILVSQETALVEVFSRTDDGTWRIQSAIGKEQDIELPSLGIFIKNQDIYYGVDF